MKFILFGTLILACVNFGEAGRHSNGLRYNDRYDDYSREDSWSGKHRRFDDDSREDSWSGKHGRYDDDSR